MKGFDIKVRFFIYDNADTEFGEIEVQLLEVSETDFLEADGEIEYERNTIFKNGVNQICLTKGNGFI